METGELLHEALRRELREETGLEVTAPEGLAFVVHHDTPEYPSAILCALEYDSWEGDITVSDDPSGDVVEARFFPLDEAVQEITGTTGPPHHQPLVEYLRGRAPAGTVWYVPTGRGRHRRAGRTRRAGQPVIDRPHTRLRPLFGIRGAVTL
ncbi:NUDIX domain-containing protein [Kitasatospora sp. NPDC056327]|uniref:NUDIX domain-containing protein n=1 Tax=Kitasatospora sp. NPDC056327 TaxID=3345785 RepID=UPI0035D954D3